MTKHPYDGKHLVRHETNGVLALWEFSKKDMKDLNDEGWHVVEGGSSDENGRVLPCFWVCPELVKEPNRWALYPALSTYTILQ